MRADLQRLKRDTDSGRSAATISAGHAELSAVGTSGISDAAIGLPPRAAAMERLGNRCRWRESPGHRVAHLSSIRPLPLPKYLAMSRLLTTVI